MTGGRRPGRPIIGGVRCRTTAGNPRRAARSAKPPTRAEMAEPGAEAEDARLRRRHLAGLIDRACRGDLPHGVVGIEVDDVGTAGPAHPWGRVVLAARELVDIGRQTDQSVGPDAAHFGLDDQVGCEGGVGGGESERDTTARVQSSRATLSNAASSTLNRRRRGSRGRCGRRRGRRSRFACAAQPALIRGRRRRARLGSSVSLAARLVAIQRRGPRVRAPGRAGSALRVPSDQACVTSSGPLASPRPRRADPGLVAGRGARRLNAVRAGGRPINCRASSPTSATISSTVWTSRTICWRNCSPLPP